MRSTTRPIADFSGDLSASRNDGGRFSNTLDGGARHHRL